MRYVRGPLLNSRILLPVGIRAFEDDPTKDADWTVHEFTALIDTGATRTAISQNVIDRARLSPRGQIPVGNVKRTEMHETYMFWIGVWPESLDGAAATFFGIGDALMGIDGGDSRYYDVLLGMDVITQGSLSTNLDESFELAFPG